MTEAALLATILEEYSTDEPRQEKSAAEIRLEQIVLGKESDFEDVLRTAQKQKAYTEDIGEPETADEVAGEEADTAAWHDEDDDDLIAVAREKRYKRFRTTDEQFVSANVLSKRMRNEYQTNLPTPSWATRRPKMGADGPTSALTTSTGSYIDRESERLPLKGFDVKRLTNLNYENPAKKIVHAVEFHPRERVGLVGSFEGHVTLFDVDGKTNPKKMSVFFDRFPVSCAHFLNGGDEFLASSRDHPHMYVFDVGSQKSVRIPWNKAIAEKGFKSFSVSPDHTVMAFPARDGSIHMLSGKSKEWLYSLKMNGSTAAVAFSGDSRHLYSIGDAGRVHVWDLAARKCQTTFMDDGCVSGTAIAGSPNSEFVAVGSNTGVVNVYETRSVLHGKTVPVKTVLNLTTSITCLKFNPTSELLAMGSNYTHAGLKLLHLGEMQVVANFPELNQKIRKAEIVDFSPLSGYMALGNDKGEALLYRLGHYKGY
ncbi:U3 small nucleolar RNA-associated protein 18-like protein [Hypsibius exemplaris]|uniref:U3 small nucleolar RNA-associated protein 18-like protein n=1 Tax=Hypsibius exemplaris TaxID=2072580 RepID=A0A1W0X6G3_HYPEX|nr:U3 small nucleolar RNA-associated protein 18-like protein [Hypsibius exemplaris]